MKISDLPHQPTTQEQVNQAATRVYVTKAQVEALAKGNNQRDPTIDPETERLRALNAKDRRDRIAEGFAFALASKAHGSHWSDEGLAILCKRMANALIAELDRT